MHRTLRTPEMVQSGSRSTRWFEPQVRPSGNLPQPFDPHSTRPPPPPLQLGTDGAEVRWRLASVG